MDVLIIDKIHPVLQDRFESQGWRCVNGEEWSAQQVHAELGAFKGLVLRSKINVSQAVLEANSQLRFIGRVGSGLEHIDLAFAEKKGIPVFSSPEGNRQAVAEHALGALLALFNRIVIADNQVRNGTWQRKTNQGIELQGKTVGLIGLGNTGAALARLLNGFGVEVLAYDKYILTPEHDHAKRVEMDELFQHADVVSIHLPLNSETQHLVNEKWLNRFKKPIYLINTSRGQILDTMALVQAMKHGKVLGVCLDVIEYEAKNLSMPDFQALPPAFHELCKMENVIITPHIAGLTHESYEKLSNVLADKILMAFKDA